MIHSTPQNVQKQLQSDDQLHFVVQLAESLGAARAGSLLGSVQVQQCTSRPFRFCGGPTRLKRLVGAPKSHMICCSA